MSEPDYKKLSERMLEFQKFLDMFWDIERRIFLPDHARKDRLETDTEHSYHLAMHAWFLSQHFPGLNKEKILKYALAHDLVEIYAGDVMAIGRTDKEQAAKEAREKEAFERITAEWADFPEMLEALKAYEEKSDAEAVFVNALDKITPILHQFNSKGKTWKKWDMDRAEVLHHKDTKTKHSKEVNALWKELRKVLLEHPEWFNEGKTS